MDISVKLINISKVLFLGCILTSSVSAQDQLPESVTIDKLELYKSSNLWMNTLNSAGLNLSDTLTYTDAFGGYTQTKGDFRRQQEGGKNDGFIFDAEGATTLKGAYLWGNFSIETEKKRDARFNASIIDPFRGMPYIIADDRSSDWRLQYYNLETKVASPKLLDKFYAGIGLNYRVSTGAKQLDPRPQNRYYSLELTPSIVWTINDNHNLGGVFYYKNMHETSDIGFKNSYQNATFYYLEGLGAFTQTTGTDRQRDYRGNSFGGELQYSIQNKGVDFLFSGGYVYDYEDVIDGSKKIINDAKATRDNYSGKITLVLKGDRQNHRLSAEGVSQHINGVFYDKIKDPNDPAVGQIILYEKTRSKFKTTQFNLGYDYYRLKNGGYSWYAGAKVNYLIQKDEYLLPQPGVESSYQNIHRYDFDVHGKFNINKRLPFNGQLLFGASVLYSLGQDCELGYGGLNPEHVIVTELLNKDYQFLSANYWKVGFDLQYSIPLTVSKKNVNAYGKINGYIIPEVNQENRTNLMVSLGFIL